MAKEKVVIGIGDVGKLEVAALLIKPCPCGQIPMGAADTVKCACGAFVYAESAAAALSRWNRAVEKLDTLKACCKKSKNQVARQDDRGLVLVKCTACGIRHFPLLVAAEKEKANG